MKQQQRLRRPKDTFHNAVWPFLLFTQFFGVMPLYGITNRDFRKVRFRWFSLRVFLSVIISVSGLIHLIVSVARSVKLGVTLGNTGETKYGESQDMRSIEGNRFRNRDILHSQHLHLSHAVDFCQSLSAIDPALAENRKNFLARTVLQPQAKIVNRSANSRFGRALLCSAGTHFLSRDQCVYLASANQTMPFGGKLLGEFRYSSTSARLHRFAIQSNRINPAGVHQLRVDCMLELRGRTHRDDRHWITISFAANQHPTQTELWQGNARFVLGRNAFTLSCNGRPRQVCR